MPTWLIIVLAIMAGAAAGAIWWRISSGRKNKNQSENDSGFLLLQNQLSELVKIVDQKLTESSRTMFDSLRNQANESNKIIRDIVQELTKVGEGQKQVLNFADQLKNLQDILKNPKQRGVLGEYFLETLLKNVLPTGSYQMQYPFRDGTIVDAAVFVKDKIIPIDSKFSLENYNRLAEEKDPAERERLEKLFKQDLKNRIDETAKYVKPSEGTMDFAFMFIPHEAIYYDLLIAQVGAVKVNTRDLVEYAFKDKHVIIVSPTSFLAYLQTVLQGLKALQIEESAKEIRARVEDLGRHLTSYEDYLRKLGVSLGTSVNQYNLAYKELKKIDKDVTRITGTSPEIETLTLDKPSAIEE
ncbi:MAG TPA: DNA recombination protein RmuC [Candidatus Paceibacterota bacterium]